MAIPLSTSMETNESAVDYNPLHVRNLRDARRAPRMLTVLVRRLMSLEGVGAPPLPRLLVFLRACARGPTGLDPLFCRFSRPLLGVVFPRSRPSIRGRQYSG